MPKPTRYRLTEDGKLRDRDGEPLPAGQADLDAATVLSPDGEAVGRVVGLTVEWFSPHTPLSIGGESSLSLFGQEHPGTTPSPSLPTETQSDISVLWQHYQQTIPNGSRYKFDARRKRIIRRALEYRTVDECRRAIDGLAASDYHVQNRYLDIQYALGLRNESPDERIDKMAIKAPHVAGSSSVPSDEPAKLTPDQEDRLDEDVHAIQWMFEHPIGVNLTGGEQALIRLQRYGLEIELDESRTRVVRISTATVEDPRLARLQPLIEQRVRQRFGF